MKQFVTKKRFVEAEQFDQSSDQAVRLGFRLEWREAKQCYYGRFSEIRGEMIVRPGDWIVRHPYTVGFEIMPEDHFAAMYEHHVEPAREHEILDTTIPGAGHALRQAARMVDDIAESLPGFPIDVDIKITIATPSGSVGVLVIEGKSGG